MTKLEELLETYEILPFQRHPLWRAILKKELSKEEIVRAEAQHFLRTRFGQGLRRDALHKIKTKDSEIWSVLLQTYLEECTDSTGTLNHLELIKRFVVENGIKDEELNSLIPTPGNSAAMALYKDISDRGPGCHIIGAGVVEKFYSELCPKIYNAYVKEYGFSPHQAETYSLHSSMDSTHSKRAFLVLNRIIDLNGWDATKQSVRDAFVATSLHYDGMLQAAIGGLTYWDGRN